MSSSAIPAPPPDASPSQRGLVNETTQSFAGAKTFDSVTVTGAVTAGSVTVAGVPLETSATVNYFVETTGSDTTGTGTALLPFATIQHAINLVPKKIKHLVTIKIGIGNFAGFVIQGFSVEPADLTIPCGLDIQGTLVTATPATGTATGTSSSGTTANFGTNTKAALNDITQTWTTDDLKGKLLVTTAVNAYYPIVGNSSTSLKVMVGDTPYTALDAYAIKDWGTVITSSGPAHRPPPIPSLPSVTPSVVTNYLAWYANNKSSFPGSEYKLQCIKFAPPASTSGIWINDTSGIGAGLSISACKFSLVNTGNTYGVLASGEIIVGSSVFEGINTVTSYGLYLNRCSFATVSLGAFFMNSSPGYGIFVYGSQSLPFSFYVYIENAGVGISVDAASINLSTGWIHGCGKGVRLHFGLTSGVSPSSFECYNPFYIGTCTTAAIEMNGNAWGTLGGNGSVHGTGNLVGMALNQGARLKYGPANTLAGTTEISLDGTGYTLVNLRAASPRVLSNAYFTAIYE